MIELIIPFPPSVNHYKRVGRMVTTRSGKTYQSRVNTNETKMFYYEVWVKIRSFMALKRMEKPLDSTIALQVYIRLHAPDKRRRDIDNNIKIILDSLVRGGLIEDDSQIARLYVERCSIIESGEVEVRIEVIV